MDSRTLIWPVTMAGQFRSLSVGNVIRLLTQEPPGRQCRQLRLTAEPDSERVRERLVKTIVFAEGAPIEARVLLGEMVFDHSPIFSRVPHWQTYPSGAAPHRSIPTALVYNLDFQSGMLYWGEPGQDPQAFLEGLLSCITV